MKKRNIIIIIITILAIGIGGYLYINLNEREDYIAKIDNYKIYPEEYYIYFRDQQMSFEKIGGANIWKTKIYGEPTLSLAKEYALDSLVYTKLMSDASKGEVSISGDEKVEYIKEAQNYYNSLMDSEKELISYEYVELAMAE